MAVQAMGGRYDDLFKQALEKAKLLTPQQIGWGTRAVGLLARHGIRKTLADALVSLKLLDVSQAARINKQIGSRQQVSPIFNSAAKDEQVRRRLLAEGPEGQRKLARCAQIKTALQQSGLPLGVYDVALGLGLYDPEKIQRATVERPSKRRNVAIAVYGSIAAALVAIAVIVVIVSSKPHELQQPTEAKIKEPVSPTPRIAPTPAPAPEPKKVEPRTPDFEPPVTKAHDPAPLTRPPTPAQPETPTPVKPEPAEPSPATTQEKPPVEAADSPKPPTLDKPAPQKEPDKEKGLKKEDKAKKLHEEAETAFGAREFKTALGKYKALWFEYWHTKFVLFNLTQIRDRIRECVRTIAEQELAGATLGKEEYRDAVGGFTFRPPAGWRGIPPDARIKGFTDDWETLAHPGESIGRGSYLSNFSDDIYAELIQTARPDSLAFMAKTAEERMQESMQLVQRESKEVTLGGNVLLRGIYTNDAHDHAVVTYSAFQQFGGNKRGVRINVHWRGAKGTELGPLIALWDKAAATLRILSPQQRGSLQAQIGRTVVVPGWSRLETPHYSINFNTTREQAQLLGKHLEAILALYLNTIGAPDHRFRCDVRFFNDREEFDFYAKLGAGVAAYYSPMQREIVAYRLEATTIKSKETDERVTLVREGERDDEGTFRVIYHEAFHQFCDEFLRANDREVSIPSWFNEGMGDYFFGGTWTKGKLEIGVNSWRLKTIYKAVKEKKHVPLKDLFSYTQRQYYKDPGLCYAEGWSLCYFILKSKNPAYLGIFQKLLFQLKRVQDGQKVMGEVLKGIELTRLETEWSAFILKLGEENPSLLKDSDEDE